LEKIIKHLGIKNQVRDKTEALNIIDMTKGDDEYNEQTLESAIEKDLLCGLAWFNLGIVQHKNGKHEDAAISFAMCGLVQTWDIEAFVNATLCCFNQNETISILPLILRTGYYYNGDRFLSKLYAEFNERFDPLLLAELTDVIEEVLPTKNIKTVPSIRVMGADGIFRDIFGEKA